MNKAYRFTKMQGAGNDFILLDNTDGSIPPEDYPALALRLCRRQISLGADGLMIVTRARRDGDYAMEFFNADGSRGEMCGNGARCIARYGHDRGLAGETQRIETTAGLVIGQRIREDQYRVRLNDPSICIPRMRVEALETEWDCAYLELGDPGIPHAVVHLDRWDEMPRDELGRLGRALRYASPFPRGANVTFWKLCAPGRVKAITYERGVEDFTLACGTGAGCTAASVCLSLPGEESPITLDFPGGQLHITLTAQENTVRDIYLTGPATVVAEGIVYLR